jgi:hypothetical protein
VKRPATSSGINFQKVFFKGVDKIIRENLKKNKSKEEEEYKKQYVEDLKSKLKKVELS